MQGDGLGVVLERVKHGGGTEGEEVGRGGGGGGGG